MKEKKYADVIIDISHEKVDRTFQYKIPEALRETVLVGTSVMVPFGRGNRLSAGYVVEITDQAEFDEEKMKEIYSLSKQKVSPSEDALKLAVFLKETYGSTMIAALKTVLPVKREVKAKEKKTIVRQMTGEEIRSLLAESIRKHQTGKTRFLAALTEEKKLPYELVTGKLHIAPSTIKSLISQQVITVETESYYRNPVRLEAGGREEKKLSSEQQAIVDTVIADRDAGICKTYLIHGITGSGKTEVYLSLIEETVKRGRQCIMLIPEIALTYQTLLRFYKRFGDRVSVLNSSLSEGERYDQCERARKGEIDVIIGPRSALFVPFEKLGMIVIDEEHEPSYKSETMPRYHARETAEYLASLKGASLVLGSATPSLEAYSRAKKGEYELFTLTRRLTGGRLADVSVVDLRKELKEGNRSIFSRKLQELIEDRLSRKEQIMLFLNRRGYAGFVSCRSCGLVMKCPHCDVSLSQHRGGKLVCHYCGYEMQEPKKCPSCGSPYILGFKAGTQQIEDQIRKRFPGAGVLRMDADTTRRKGSYEEILSSFAGEEADILLGTQMIVKGHDFPKVTLMGVLAADLSLNDSDYHCGERTFQLLTQAAGRAGRGVRKGEVVIQTYQPDHYSITLAATQDYEAFYEEEMGYRELMGYPPAEHLLAILFTSKEEGQALAVAEETGRILRNYQEESGRSDGSVIGPSKAAVSKINDIYRFVIYCKEKDYQKLLIYKELTENYRKNLPGNSAFVQFDFDPVNTY